MSSSPLSYPLTLANGQQVFRIVGAYAGGQQVVFACTAYPAAGTLSLEYQLAGDPLWRPAPKGTLLPLTGPIVLSTYGAVSGYRVTIAGLSGGSGLAAWVAQVEPEGFPPGAFVGLRALTTQSYIEANVKSGVQYEVSSYAAALAAGANQDTVFTTGASPVLVKTRQIGFDAAKLEARVYGGVTYTGGSLVPYFNLNLRNPVAGTVAIRSGATITGVGVEVAAASYMVGSTENGNRTVGTFQLSGLERLLNPNTNYMLRITNTSAAPSQVSTYISWYEGGTDLPV